MFDSVVQMHLFYFVLSCLMFSFRACSKLSENLIVACIEVYINDATLSTSRVAWETSSSCRGSDSSAAECAQSHRNGRSSVAALDSNYRVILAGITAR